MIKTNNKQKDRKVANISFTKEEWEDIEAKAAFEGISPQIYVKRVFTIAHKTSN